MADYLVRALSSQFAVLGLACVTTGLVEEASRLHGTSRTASAALGRALTGGLLMGALLKRGQRVALRFEGSGPLRKILVEAESEGTVRGYVGAPGAEVPFKDEKLNVSGAVGSEGSLTVIKDLGLKEPYTGIVNLLSGEIAEDIAYYLAESEQIPSAVGLGVFVEPDGKVSASGGFLLQALPPRDEKLVEQLIENVRRLPGVTDLLRQGKIPEDILQEVFAGIPFHMAGKRHELYFRCKCSRGRVEKVLIALGVQELEEIVAEQGEADVTCEYCRSRYHFTREELAALCREAVPVDGGI